MKEKTRQLGSPVYQHTFIFDMDGFSFRVNWYSYSDTFKTVECYNTQQLWVCTVQRLVLFYNLLFFVTWQTLNTCISLLKYRLHIPQLSGSHCKNRFCRKRWKNCQKFNCNVKWSTFYFYINIWLEIILLFSSFYFSFITKIFYIFASSFTYIAFFQILVHEFWHTGLHTKNEISEMYRNVNLFFFWSNHYVYNLNTLFKAQISPRNLLVSNDIKIPFF